jgi:amino acid transporter
LVCYLV